MPLTTRSVLVYIFVLMETVAHDPVLDGSTANKTRSTRVRSSRILADRFFWSTIFRFPSSEVSAILPVHRLEQISDDHSLTINSCLVLHTPTRSRHIVETDLSDGSLLSGSTKRVHFELLFNIDLTLKH